MMNEQIIPRRRRRCHPIRQVVTDTLSAVCLIVGLSFIGIVRGQSSSIIGNLPCSICGVGERVTNSLALIPANTVSFIDRPITCFRLEFQALASQYTPFQCIKLALNQDIKKICGCEPRPKPTAAPTVPAPTTSAPTASLETVPPTSVGTGIPTGPTAAPTSNFVIVKGDVIITLEPVADLMSEVVQKEYEAQLLTFFKKYLLNAQSVSTLEQTIVNGTSASGRRKLHNMRHSYATDSIHRLLQASTGLQTLVQVDYVASKDSSLVGTDQLDQSLVSIVNNNTEELLKTVNTINYFANVTTASGTLPPQPVTPTSAPTEAASDDGSGLSIGAIVGIIVGVIAIMLVIPVAFQLLCVTPPPPYEPSREFKSTTASTVPTSVKIKTRDDYPPESAKAPASLLDEELATTDGANTDAATAGGAAAVGGAVALGAAVGAYGDDYNKEEEKEEIKADDVPIVSGGKVYAVRTSKTNITTEAPSTSAPPVVDGSGGGGDGPATGAIVAGAAVGGVATAAIVAAIIGTQTEDDDDVYLDDEAKKDDAGEEIVVPSTTTEEDKEIAVPPATEEEIDVPPAAEEEIAVPPPAEEEIAVPSAEGEIAVPPAEEEITIPSAASEEEEIAIPPEEEITLPPSDDSSPNEGEVATTTTDEAEITLAPAITTEEEITLPPSEEAVSGGDDVAADAVAGAAVIGTVAAAVVSASNDTMPKEGTEGSIPHVGDLNETEDTSKSTHTSTPAVVSAVSADGQSTDDDESVEGEVGGATEGEAGTGKKKKKKKNKKKKGKN